MKRIKKFIDETGGTWDSKTEYLYYLHLIEHKQEYKIKEIKRQVKYVLQDSFYIHNKKVQAVTYKSDFTLVLDDGTNVIIDVKPPVKSIWDSKFNIKWKIMMCLHRDFIFKIVAYKNKTEGFVEM
jgi:hypothetical protein